MYLLHIKFIYIFHFFMKITRFIVKLLKLSCDAEIKVLYKFFYLLLYITFNTLTSLFNSFYFKIIKILLKYYYYKQTLDLL